MIPTFGGTVPNHARPDRHLHAVTDIGEAREVGDVTLYRGEQTGGAWISVDLGALADELTAALETVKADGYDTVGECLRIADAAAEIAGAR